MTRDECNKLLHELYQPTAAADTDMLIGLEASGETVVYRVHPDGLLDAESMTADVTFSFASWEATVALLTGQRDPIAAFMAGEFRSDGYLTAVFLVLSIFSRPHRPDVPD